MPRPRVLLADDHRIFSEGLCRILERQFEVVGMVKDGRDLLATARQLRPDVVVADISMPSLNGIEAVSRLRKTNQRMKVVILTMHEDAIFATSAFRAGASGYVLKRGAPEELITAIREALQGHVYVSPLIGGHISDKLMEKHGHPEQLKAELTPRQREILQLLAEGKSAKEVAGILKISPRTAEFHKYRIMDATGARTTADLTRYAVAHGIVGSQ